MIRISSRDRIIYTAIVLDEKSRHKIQSMYRGVHENYFAEHVTLSFGKNEPHPQHGETVQFTADAYATDKDGEVLRVNIGNIQHDNPIPHVSISTASGVGPKYNNELVKRAKEIPPIGLFGRISAYDGRKFI